MSRRRWITFFRCACLLVSLPIACHTPSISTDDAPTAAVSSCYLGPMDLKVQYADGTPASNAPVGIFSMLWLPDPVTGKPTRYPRTHRTDREGRFHKAQVRECMTPTWFYASDEEKGLAALLPISEFDQIGEPKTLTLQQACWLTGRIKNNPEPRKFGIYEYGHFVFLSPGETPSSRYLKQGCGESGFRFLVPPGTYLIRLGYENAIVKDIRIDVPAGMAEYDVGVLEFEVEAEDDAQ